MPKRVRLVSDTGETPPQEVKETNWSLCIVCQDDNGSLLLDPSRNKDEARRLQGYKTASENIITLKENNSLPRNVFPTFETHVELNEHLKSNNAKWHKVCYVSLQKKVERLEDKEPDDMDNAPQISPKKQKLRSGFSNVQAIEEEENEDPLCFFCEKELLPDKYEIHKASTKDINTNVKTMAYALKDERLRVKMSSGKDMCASDAVYHKICLTQLYTRYRAMCRSKEKDDTIPHIEPEFIAFNEVLSYIESYRESDDSHIFKLSHLVTKYKEGIKELGGDGAYVHHTRLKERLKEHIPDLTETKGTYGVIFSFEKKTGDSLLFASQYSEDSNEALLRKAAQMVRKEIFEMNYCFEGHFDEQYDVLPESLMLLIKMILGGLDVENEVTHTIAESITQLVVFNAVKRGRKEKQIVKHNPKRETLLPLYLGLMIHSKTRKRELVDVLFQKGLSVSYDRITQITTDLANSVILQYEQEDVVCPNNLRTGLFTTGNLDNIDHNPSSTSAHTSFHGTAISLTQHVVCDNAGADRDTEPFKLLTLPNKPKTIKQLPESYTMVHSVALKQDPPMSETLGNATPVSDILCSDEKQSDWLMKVNGAIQNDPLQKTDNISWSAHFADLQPSLPRPPAITGLLPLFQESAHTVAMVRHGMDLIMKATSHVNPSQVPVLTVDQPLFAIAKKIQWTWPELYGEERFTVLMGGLHIEMNWLKLLGEWLDGSGWTAAVAAADVTTEGRADDLLRGSHTSRCQWTHQVTAAALHILQHNAYEAYQDTVSPEEALSFANWIEAKCSNHPQFFYWKKTLDLEILFLQFLRAQRLGNFKEYIETLGKMLPWMFSMSHTNYARWMTIHVRDLTDLPLRCQDNWNAFNEGLFVTQKTTHKFSMLAHDQIHEQLNAVLKGDGGVIGIIEREAALRRWMVAGPEVSRLLDEYEAKDTNQVKDKTKHHEQTPTVQKTFTEDVRKLVSVIDDWGNPFTADSAQLFALDTKVVVSDAGIQQVETAEVLGNDQYASFVQERVTGSTRSVHDTIKKNNLTLCKMLKKKSKSTAKSKVSNLKDDIQLFSRMMIVSQEREGDLKVFFSHENHPWPPALSENNSMRSGKKADLLTRLEPLAETILPCGTHPPADVLILDGAALVHSLDPKRINREVNTIDEYSRKIFIPYVVNKLNDVKQVDIVWDTYRVDSLKAGTRENRGKGQAVKVVSNTCIPKNWSNFLRHDNNKTELFEYLAQDIATIPVPAGKTIVTTSGDHVLSTNELLDLGSLQPCTHEEADSRMFLHASRVHQRGLTKIVIKATDTDVVVMAIATASVFDDAELWVAFGNGDHFRYIAAHEIAQSLGPILSRGLLLLHCFSGCDTVSFFSGISKTNAFDVWRAMPEVGPLFQRLSMAPPDVGEADLDVIERFVVRLYKKPLHVARVNEARMQLFCQGNRSLEHVPPTQNALVQHTRRAVFQAGHIWGQCHIKAPIVPSPAEWGWQKDTQGDWFPLWSTQPEASRAVRELIKCGCKKGCVGRCGCSKAKLRCTQLCTCAGQCTQELF